MNEEQRKANRKGNIYAACVIGYAVIMLISYLASSEHIQTKFGFVIALSLLMGGTLWVTICFVLDLIQYSREGWNFHERNTRLPFVVAEGSSERIPAERAMWFGYPLSLTVFWILTIGCAYVVLVG